MPSQFTWIAFLAPIFSLVCWPVVRSKRTFISLIPTAVLLGYFLWQAFNLPALEPVKAINFMHQNQQFEWTLQLVLSTLPLFLAALSCFISLLIQLFSFRYLDKDQPFGYYFFLINLFTAAMSWLFLAGNLFTLMMGWELVGICSYLLVQFWYQSERPVQAGFRVVMINKLGDISLLCGLGLLFSFGLGGMIFNRLQVPEGADVFFQSTTGTILCLFLVTAALVKSAQFPFNLWLKEAMEGPTSVSALLHSATMVVAGLWLLVQLSPMFGENVRHFLLIFGCISLIVSSIAAAFSSHFKFILAFSTLSQLALLTLAIGLGKTDEASVHIITHAFFKSSLFLTCGLVMHWAHHLGFHGVESQYLPTLKGYLRHKAWIRFPFILSAAALAGVPLSSGYISKEALVPDVFHAGTDFWLWMAYVSMQIGILATAFYSFRLVWWLCLVDEDQPVVKEKIGLIFGIPIVLLSLGAGFWLVGPNPFSSDGWLLPWLEMVGHTVHFDIGFMVLGGLAGWFSIRKGKWELASKPSWLSFTFIQLKPQVLAFSALWKLLLRFSTMATTAEQRLIERPIDLVSKGTVVGGHFFAFADRKVVDGAVMMLASLARWIGAGLWHNSRNHPQYVVYFVVVVLGLISWLLLF